MNLTILRGVDCKHRENLTSVYRCASCQFQKGSMESLACGRGELEPRIMKMDKGGKVHCPIRNRMVKVNPYCQDCFFHNGTWMDNLKCMAGRFYIKGRKVLA